MISFELILVKGLRSFHTLCCPVIPAVYIEKKTYTPPYYLCFLVKGHLTILMKIHSGISTTRWGLYLPGYCAGSDELNFLHRLNKTGHIGDLIVSNQCINFNLFSHCKAFKYHVGREWWVGEIPVFSSGKVSSFFPLRVMLVTGCQVSFTKLKNTPIFLSVLRIFIMKWRWIFFKRTLVSDHPISFFLMCCWDQLH